MGLFLFRFWPVLIPLVVYWLWLMTVGHHAVKAGKPRPLFREGPWYWMVLASLIIGVGCFVFLGSNLEGGKGPYVPPHMKDGKLVPGKVGEEK